MGSHLVGLDRAFIDRHNKTQGLIRGLRFFAAALLERPVAGTMAATIESAADRSRRGGRVSNLRRFWIIT